MWTWVAIDADTKLEDGGGLYDIRHPDLPVMVMFEPDDHDWSVTFYWIRTVPLFASPPWG